MSAVVDAALTCQLSVVCCYMHVSILGEVDFTELNDTVSRFEWTPNKCHRRFQGVGGLNCAVLALGLQTAIEPYPISANTLACAICTRIVSLSTPRIRNER